VIEFALLSPLILGVILVLGVLGIGLHDRIQLEQILNAGAVAAMRDDPGLGEVRKRMTEAAGAKGYAIADEPNAVGAINLQSVRNCYCADELEGSELCFHSCPNGRSVGVRYWLTARYTNPVIMRLWSAVNKGNWNYFSVAGPVVLMRMVVVR